MDGSKLDLLEALRDTRVTSHWRLARNIGAVRGTPPRNPHAEEATLGARVADWVAATMGSWKFIIIQSTILLVWIALNVTAYVVQWDPYPFILLNLALSFQAAYAAPFIMMSQNRQAALDRVDAKDDYATNVKAELEIELLHAKMDELRAKEVAGLTAIIKDMQVEQLRLTEVIQSMQPEQGRSPASPDR